MKTHPLGKLADIKTGKLDVNAGAEDGVYPFFTCATTPYKINQYAFDNEAVLIAGNGDLNVKYYKGKFNAYQRTYVIQNKDMEVLSMKYLYYFMETYMDRLRRDSIGGIIKYIKLGNLSEAAIPLPPIDDQKRIAYLLGKVEGLIARRKQHLQQIDDLLKSVFLEMFGDPVRNEKGWDKPDFETIISGMRNGLSPSKVGTNKGSVYTLSAITGDSFQEIFKEDTFSQIHEKYFPSDSDFLVCRGNGNINLVGKGYFFPGVSEGVIFPDTIIAVSISVTPLQCYHA